MPELPEVETIVRYLCPRIRGKLILGLESNTPRLFRDHKNIREVRNKIVGQKIKEVSRAGKNILFRLSGGKCLAIHLMMTGSLLLDPPAKNKFTRCLFLLSGNLLLAFDDIRKFGRIRIIDSLEELKGNDALSLSFKKFKNLIIARKERIKPLFLNQKIISGIGNIYSDEILWHAGIHPFRAASSLQESEIKKLYNSMKKILNLAIKKEGSSARDYKKPDGSKGGYYEIRKAYQRTGEECLRDAGIIKRMVIGGRSAHFCPIHQL